LNGDPDLAFLYDADAIRSMSMCDEDDPLDVNDAAVVARCNEVLRAKDSMDDVLFSVREMTAAGVRPAESTYFAIMLVCRDTAVGPARAVEVYDAMKLVGVKPTRRSFDLAMTCAIRARKPEDALRLKEDCASDSRLKLSPRTFTALLKCVSECDFGRKRGAKARLIRTCRLFEEMLEETSDVGDKAVPPPAAFNVLIAAAARARQPDLVARTFEEMTATGVSPSRETYETALAAISAGGLVDVALDVFAAMRADGFAPRKTTYNSLLEACATAPQPRVEQAFEIFHRMADEGRVAPNARTFALLIDAAARANLPRFAFDAFDAARAAGVDVPLSTYNRLIRAAGGDGAETFDETSGLEYVAGSIYGSNNKSASMASLKASGGVAVARALLAEVRDNTPLEPDVYTFGSVLGTCAAAAAAGDSNSAVNAARATCEEMLYANVPHNRATRHALIATLGRAGLWREALREYVDMKSVGGDAELSELSKKKNGESGPGRETYGVVFDAILSPGGAEAAIAAVALEPGGGETFIRGARAAAARAVFRDGVDAGVFDDPRKPFSSEPSPRAKQTLARSNDDSFDEAYEKALRDGRGTDAVAADPPMRVNHVHMTRAEAVVATLALLESFADFSGEPSETRPVQNLPGGLFIGEGPGTKGNAQRRTLAVESVLRAASVPCAPVEDPRAYVVGVTREGLRNWAERASEFETLDLSAANVAALDARLDALEARDAEASAKAAETLFG
jgi:pentatricopeptide repeat protein